MPTVELRSRISAPAEALFALYADPDGRVVEGHGA